MVDNVQSQIGRAYRQSGQSTAFGGLAHGAISWVIAGADFLYLLVASTAVFVLYNEWNVSVSSDPFHYVGIGLVIAMCFVLAMHSANAYRTGAILLHRLQIRLICTLIPATLAFLLTVFFFLNLGSSISRGSIVVATAASISGLVGLRYFWRWGIPHALSRGTFGRRRVLLICSSSFPVWKLQANAISSGTTVSEIIRFSEDGSLPDDFFATLATAQRNNLDEVVVVWRDADMSRLEAHLVALRRYALPVSVAFDGVIGTIASGSVHRIGEFSAFQAQRPPFTPLENVIKRLFDICFSFVTLVVLSPMMLVVALCIKLDTRGPVLFKQVRKGYGGRTFRIIKFRSMTVQEDGPEIRQAVRNDPRITRIGAFIRSTSIDELPQFWNVLMGEMSVVGPRPHALAHDDYFEAQIGDYVFRQHVKPGLTGWAQINRCRGETPDLKKMEERVLHDLWYINNWSMFLDLKIIFRTAFQLHDTRSVY